MNALNAHKQNEKIPRAFVYLIFGQSEPHYLEARFSIMTLMEHSPATPIIVLSERCEFFESMARVKCIPLTQQLQQQWLDGDDYLFRIKLKGVQYILTHYVEKLIFLDTDTIVRTNLNHWFDQIDDQTFVLHEFEGKLAKPKFERQFRRVINQSYRLDCNRTVTITPQSPMYNSGVIGISEASLPLLDDAILLMMQVNHKTRWHTAEQLSLGILFALSGTVNIVGNRRVYHYWHKNQKKYLREQIVDFFRDNPHDTVFQSPQSLNRVKLYRPFFRWLRDKAKVF